MGFHFLEIWYDLVVQALHSIARGGFHSLDVPLLAPPGLLKNGDALHVYLIQRGINYNNIYIYNYT